MMEQHDLPPKPKESIKLRPVVRPPPPGWEGGPYSVAHYTPAGVIVKHERKGKWGYKADGGIAPEIRATTERTEPHLPKYVRPVKEEQADIDNRKQRTILRYDCSEIFREFDKDPDSHAAGFHGYSNRVVLESFNALNENANRLEEESSEEN